MDLWDVMFVDEYISFLYRVDRFSHESEVSRTEGANDELGGLGFEKRSVEKLRGTRGRGSGSGE
jgi:hypothetical protein